MYHLLYELGLNQDVQQKLYEEINQILKGDKSINEDHIEKMKYMKNVFKETQRFVFLN